MNSLGFGRRQPFICQDLASFLVKNLLADPSNSKIEDAAWLLFDQALLLEGVQLKDPAAFVQRLNRVLKQSI